MKLLSTARPIPEIMERYSGDKWEIRAHESDVETYLEGRISQDGSEPLRTYKVIGRRITELADGM